MRFSMTTNNTVLDLSKVQHGTFWWINQEGRIHQKKPKHPTVGGQRVLEELINDKNRWRLDKWQELVVFQLTANHTIKYTGSKAVSMWAVWRERIFNKEKGN